jgi:hypothetical protein
MDIVVLCKLCTLYFPADGPTHPCRAFIDPHNLCGFLRTLGKPFIYPYKLCGSLWPGITSYRVALFLHYSIQNGTFPRMLVRCYSWCGGVIILMCQHSGSHSSPHSDRGWCILRLWLSKLGGRNHASLEIHLLGVIEQVWKYTSWQSKCELGGLNCTSLEICTCRQCSYDVLGVCSTWCMSVVGVNCWLLHGEIVTDYSTSCS